MRPETAAALEASIAKWERNVQADNPYDLRLNADDCPLCRIFIGEDCQNCPVYLHTGKAYCHDTPYTYAKHAAQRWHNLPLDGTRRAIFREEAENEIAFLKSLRETGK